MESGKSKILILEDDESVRSALKEILSRAGHSVFVASRPDEANSILASNSNIEFLFCDCLLPQMTGLDFIKQARANYPSSKFKVVLMSGIYTDKSFIQEATQSTQAVAFMKKPFDMEQVLKIVKKEEAPRREESSARKLLYQMFANPTVTNRQKRKVIESIEEVSGFDLPFLYSLLVETKSGGYLNIYNADGSVSGISFCNGNIVGVDVDDKTTFLGEMLIQSGYATPQDVQEALRVKNNRRIGDYLIQNNQLSPHAFDLILMEQMNIRLVRTIVDQKIRVNFASAEVEMSNPSIDADSLSFYLHDWIASKISVNWLKSLYVMWSGNIIVKSPTFRDDHPALSMSLVKSLEGLTVKLNNQITLTQLLDIKGYNEVAVYKAIHFLLTKGLIVFAQRAAFASPAEQLKVIKKIATELENKNSYEIVAYMETGTGGGSAESILSDFMTLLGDEPTDTASEVYSQWHKVRKLAEDAMTASKDTNKIDQIRQATQRNEAEAKLRANSLMEEVKKALQYTQYAKALELLAEVSKLNPQTQQLHLYSSWAKLGSVEVAKKNFVLKEVELELMQVPPDERYDTLFPFVIGLFNKTKGDMVAARKSFEKSVALDPSFIPARREISVLAAANKKQDVFNVDLKQVVSGFFKKK
ncbi:response regulator [Bdellovibrio bacteriovorus]|uniref:Two-component response regulator n=1 Tax=Bdellovibrio bacteriovorus (strain ATCC 15356 / DSM 50701 / NCIMB 9529 / HD100) TaxID=264462 RepID=Q6MKI8_BDEBA|nr:response regulator [Bdellovibrio bacteriovorus]CAE80219.1 two-component response regulator [Bdellovibrio bacteriovorus HD100]